MLGVGQASEGFRPDGLNSLWKWEARSCAKSPAAGGWGWGAGGAKGSRKDAPCQPRSPGCALSEHGLLEEPAVPGPGWAWGMQVGGSGQGWQEDGAFWGPRRDSADGEHTCLAGSETGWKALSPD